MENESIETKTKARGWLRFAVPILRYRLSSLLLTVTVAAVVTWYFWSPSPLGNTKRVLDFLVSQDAVRPSLEEVSRLDYVWGGYEVIWGPGKNGPVSPHKLGHLFEDFLIGNDKFDDAGYKFEQFTTEGDGISCFMVWQRPDKREPPALVCMTESGRLSVVMKNFWNLPFALAHDVRVYDDEIVRRSKPKKDESELSEWKRLYELNRKQALVEYREAVIKEFGKLPPLEELVEDTVELNKELQEWLEAARKVARLSEP